MNAPSQAILLTPAGSAAIAVVRLIGPRVGGFLCAHFSRPAQIERPVHGTLADGSRVIDDPVVVLSGGGELADINLHGGPWVTRAVLDLARRAGFEVVEETGASSRMEAVDGDTLLEREIAAYLPLAKTELGLRVLLAQAEAWKRFCAKPVDPGELCGILEDRSLCWLLSLPRVGIIGAPNVGKSTLANQLFAQERSITADLPGTTRDWIGEIANIDGLAVMLLDTPGLHETLDPIERMAIERSGQEIRRADLVVLVLDATQPLEGGQAELLQRHPEAICVVNKCDRAAVWKDDENSALQAATKRGNQAVRTVATTGQGIAELRRAIARHFGCDSMDPTRPRFWTDRQKKILQQSLEDPSLISDF
ncbi:MAG: GTP-binding protein [Bacillota bacterium]